MNTLFSQPTLMGIAGNLFVPLANKVQLPRGQFGLELWQANPATPDGLLVPNEFDYSSDTGFGPHPPLIGKQLGFANKAGASCAQVNNNTVGVYLNSADLPGSPDGQKMMITPQYAFAAPVAVFATPASEMHGSMQLQIPTAVGNAYVSADHQFLGPNGVKLSYGIKLFANVKGNAVTGTGFDAPSGSYMINPPLGLDNRFVTAASGAWTDKTWTGFMPLAWTVSEAQFAAALAYLHGTAEALPSVSPADYHLSMFHLNAEFTFGPAPAELGWSMRELTIANV